MPEWVHKVLKAEEAAPPRGQPTGSAIEGVLDSRPELLSCRRRCTRSTGVAGHGNGQRQGPARVDASAPQRCGGEHPLPRPQPLSGATGHGGASGTSAGAEIQIFVCEGQGLVHRNRRIRAVTGRKICSASRQSPHNASQLVPFSPKCTPMATSFAVSPPPPDS